MCVGESQVIHLVRIRRRINGVAGYGGQGRAVRGEVGVPVGPTGEVIHMVGVGGRFHGNISVEDRHIPFCHSFALQGIALGILESDGEYLPPYSRIGQVESRHYGCYFIGYTIIACIPACELKTRTCRIGRNYNACPGINIAVRIVAFQFVSSTHIPSQCMGGRSFLDVVVLGGSC